MKNHTIVNQTKSGSYYSRITYNVQGEKVVVTTLIKDYMWIIPSETYSDTMTLEKARENYRTRLQSGYKKA